MNFVLLKSFHYGQMKESIDAIHLPDDRAAFIVYSMRPCAECGLELTVLLMFRRLVLDPLCDIMEFEPLTDCGSITLILKKRIVGVEVVIENDSEGIYRADMVIQKRISAIR